MRRRCGRRATPVPPISAWATKLASPASITLADAHSGGKARAKIHWGTDMKTRASAAKQPLEIVEVDLDGPRSRSVVEIMATDSRQTDAYTLEPAKALPRA